MFIRGPHPESVIWPHFRSGWEGFAFGQRDGVYEAQLVPNADRTVELFLALLEHLAPAVDVVLGILGTSFERVAGTQLSLFD